MFRRDRALSAIVPTLEESLKYFVDEPATRSRRQRRLVLGNLVELQYVRRKELKRAILIPLERADGVSSRLVSIGSSRRNRVGRSLESPRRPRPRGVG